MIGFFFAVETASYFLDENGPSPINGEPPSRRQAALLGLLNRCERIAVGMLALTQSRDYGEVSAILNRCIYESSVTLAWLASDKSEERLEKYLAASVRPELEFSKQLEDRIAARNNIALPIEDKMLDSMNRAVASTGISKDRILSTKRMDPLAAMSESVGHDRMTYVINQRLGSHAVHGTWVNLISDFMVSDSEGDFRAKRGRIETHANQYAMACNWVLAATGAYASAVFDEPLASTLSDEINTSTEKMVELLGLISADDYRSP